MKTTSLKRKIELSVIEEWICKNDKVLDLGCGRGVLLEHLENTKNIYGIGVDLNFEKISACVKRGVNVFQEDVLSFMGNFEENSFDWVICSTTLQEMENPAAILKEALRVGKKVVVGFINNGFYKNRVRFLLNGKKIKDNLHKNDWENSNLENPLSVNDFRLFCEKNSICILKEHFLTSSFDKQCKTLPSVFAKYALFQISVSKQL